MSDAPNPGLTGLGKFISDRPRTDPILEQLRLPAGQMTVFLRKRARMLVTFDSSYGPTAVFRIDWKTPLAER